MLSPETVTTFDQTHELFHRVESRLKIRLGSQICDFRMSTRGDGLILEGRVRTYYGKQVAQHVVMELSGLRIAANQIEIV